MFFLIAFIFLVSVFIFASQPNLIMEFTDSMIDIQISRSVFVAVCAFLYVTFSMLVHVTLGPKFTVGYSSLDI